MWLVLSALRRPMTIVVAVLAVVSCSMLALRQMKVDIFPEVGSPTIYVAQPYGGMDPAQMEGFITYYYEYHFFYVSGIEHVESKNIQGASLMKLVFHPGTNMSQALSEVVAAVNRSRSFMPPGAVPPFIARVDPGGLPVGMLVFSSPTRGLGEIQDLALNRIRPMFAGLPGVSAPPPFGGNQRTVVVNLDPQRMRAYRLSPDEAIAALNGANAILPSGNVREGSLTRIARTNAVVGENLQDLLDTPVRTGSGPAVYLRDVGSVALSTDILSGYAHVNGRRAVYINVTKRADASTLAVIKRVREALPSFRNLVPEDINVSLEFDQSGYVSRAIRALVNEGVLGAILTGLTILLVLRDWRSALIVITTIPASLLAAVVWLWAAGQTINIMTLGGLALAVGVLVDEATVEVENIHTQMAGGLSRARSVLDAAQKTAQPRLLAMLCILSVFVPSFFMTGLGRQLFVPLSLAVGFAMISSYVLSTTLVPIMAVRLMRKENHRPGDAGLLGTLKRFYTWYLSRVLRFRWPLAAVYAATSIGLIAVLVPRLGTQIFPDVDFGQFQLRLRAPTGTRVERTETIALKTLDLLQQEIGKESIAISTAFIGVQPSSYPVNTIHLWTGGPHEAVMQVALAPGARLRSEELKERLRTRLGKELPGVAISFEAGDIVSKVMSFGSATPVEVAVQGPDLSVARVFADKVHHQLQRLPFLRDLQYAQPMDYPTMDIAIDRDRAGQFGLTVADVARSLVAATSSSRFVSPNYWRDPKTGNAFQIQIEIPQRDVSSASDVRGLPVMQNGSARPLVGDVAKIGYGTAMGVIERYNMQRVVSLTANLHGITVGAAQGQIESAIQKAGELPRGVSVALRGQIPPLAETLRGLAIGLLLAIAVIYLLLAANFQSFRLSFAVLSTVPAVLVGVFLMLLATGTTLNVQSFMGAIMAVGIAVANAILLVSFAESARRDDRSVLEAAVEGARGRLRAILMTAGAMIAGMIPIALAFGEGAEQTAPLGRAVIGGLLVATFATLTVVPLVYAIVQRHAGLHSDSLDPTDPASRYYEGA
ncbi:MAG: efflux RND transporter permease subunit [Bryobacteraceae bacterium]|nr:efflux RND transporter permease subunit [Bryobacterales bacterium]NUN00352.1 efflux RND transporter permease subunit [Bryobacteraceae bacterium]